MSVSIGPLLINQAAVRRYIMRQAKGTVPAKHLQLVAAEVYRHVDDLVRCCLAQMINEHPNHRVTLKVPRR